jgi:hypothetical protein
MTNCGGNINQSKMMMMMMMMVITTETSAHWVVEKW